MNHPHDELSPAERDQLAQELLELHFGCHEDPARLQARLDTEPAVRELQQQVLAQAAVLEAAVQPKTPPLQLTPPATGRWRWLRSPVGRLLTASTVAATAVLGFFVADRMAQSAHTRFRTEHLHLTTSAPKAVPAGAPWSFTVQTRDLDGNAVDGTIIWEAQGPNGAVLATAQAATRDGAATITMPADAQLQVPQRVLVTAQTATDRVQQMFALSTAAAGPLVYVSTDRPVYRPGEAIFVRALVLDRLTRLPVAQAPQLIATMVDGRGAPVAQSHSPTGNVGTGAFVLQVPAASAGGPHTIRVQAADGSFPTESAEIVVRSFQPPQLHKQILLDRSSYAPGARGAGTVTVTRLAAGGGSASGAKATAKLVVDGAEVWSEQQALDAAGQATFAFTVPKDVERGAARFVATIDDGGIVETELKPFVVPTGKVLVQALPEGGELVAGVPNTVYFECTDPLGRPIDGQGEVVDARGRQVAKFRTLHQGRARLAFTPSRDVSYSLRLAGHDEPFPLPAVQERGVAMQLAGNDIAAGAPLRLDVAGRGDGPWLLGVFCRGVLVGQTTLRAADDGELRTTAEVALPPVATGVLRATVFDRHLQPVAERLLRRIAGERLDVALAVKHAALSPGEQQQITVRTTDETGAGRAAIVGLGVSDLGALAMGSEPAVGLVDHAYLFADVEKGEQLGDFFFEHAASPVHVDLLLGTRGWRRFVWRNDAAAQAAIAARGAPAEGVLAREGFSHTPQVTSNLAAAQSGGQALASRAYRSERLLHDAAMLALVALCLLTIAEGIAWLLRRFSKATPILQTFVGVAAAGLLLMTFVTLQVGSGLSPDAAPAVMLAVRDFDGAGAADSFRRAERNNFENAKTALSFDEFDAVTLFPSHREFRSVPNVGDFGPRTNGLTGAFYNDGSDGDVRARSDGYFVGLVRRSASKDEDANPSYFLPPEIRDIPGEFELVYRYIHRHTPSESRADFTPTICWHPLVLTDARGEATVEFATSDAVTTWVVHADAHMAQGQGRLGQATARFSTLLPLRIDAKLPDEVAAGDVLQLPITAEVTDLAIRELSLQATATDGIRIDAGAPTALQDGRGRVLLPITIAGEPGRATLTITAKANRFTDQVKHTLVIAPRGFPHRRSLGGTVQPGTATTTKVAIPTTALPGSGRATLKLFPTPLSTMLAGLDGMLQEPHGCFEQTSSTNYPNTLVLQLLETSGDNLPVTAAARARDLLAKGYQRLVGFECKRGGFEWFGKDPGHEALTAYGLLQFHDMSRVFAVDQPMVARTRDWLLGRRNGKGDFVHDGTDHHSFGGRSQVLTNAYCTYALLQSGTKANELRAELDALVARSSSDDAYELALIALALQLGERTEAAAVRQRLAGLQKDDGSLHGSTTSITCSGGRDLIVETTGFAVLALLPDPAHAERVRKALAFVQGTRSAQGTFGASQATVCALRAIAAYVQSTRAQRTAGTLRVLAGDRVLAEQPFTADATEPVVLELWSKLQPGEQELRLEVQPKDAAASDTAPLPWAIDVAYHAEQPADDPDGACVVTTTLRQRSAREGDPIAVDVVLENRTDRELPTPIAILGLPAGCELPTRVLEDLQRGESFAHWELRGRELVLYWRQLAPRGKVAFTLDLIARVPGTSSGPASRSYLYYTPAQKRWAAPLQLLITPR
jgi:alpha-2-macroglobulin-like protein